MNVNYRCDVLAVACIHTTGNLLGQCFGSAALFFVSLFYFGLRYVIKMCYINLILSSCTRYDVCLTYNEILKRMLIIVVAFLSLPVFIL